MKKSLLNALVKKVSEKQNKNKPLNAGQIREAVKLTLDSIVELSKENQIELVKLTVK